MKQDVQAGKYYEDGGAFRVIYQPDCTHPWVHFSAEAVGNGVDFFERALGAPNPLPASNQVWQWKTAFNFLGLVGVVMFLLSFVAVALDIPYFSMLRAGTAAAARTGEGACRQAVVLGALVASAAFSLASYMWAIQNVYSKTTAFFTQTGPLTMGVWCVLSGAFTVLVLAAYYFFYGKRMAFLLWRAALLSA